LWDGGGQRLAVALSTLEKAARAANKRLTRDGARRMAVNFARLPNMLGRASNE